MLTHIQIRNFAIIDELNLELYPGMTVMTGETGAGKSIMIDALSLCMGDRADASFVREGAERAEISVTIDISRLPHIHAWLNEHEMDCENECIVRRTISKDGRSRAYVNGELIPLNKLKTLAEDFIDIHSQHAHHALLKPDTHRQLLDIYAKHVSLAQTVKQHFEKARGIEQELAALKAQENSKAHEMDLLQFQLEELQATAPKENEWDELTEQHDKLSHADTLGQDIQLILDSLSENDTDSVLPRLADLKHKLSGLTAYDNTLQPIAQMLEDAKIYCAEAASSLRAYLSNIDHDPQTLQQVDERLSLLHSLARKHRCEPSSLFATLQQIQSRFDGLNSQEEHIQALEQALKQAWADYKIDADKLSKSRAKAASVLSKDITEFMQQLGMPSGEFSIALNPVGEPSAHGLEQIVFMVKTNAGQKAHPLHKVASGGELSRISLALQVTIVQDDMLPVIVFDEVDVGIGGGTAEIVGHLLNRLGQKAQVLCVTHLPQVAAQGDHHFFITKKTEDGKTRTHVNVLDKKGRIEEVARMLGGVKITDKTLQHAQEMLGG